MSVPVVVLLWFAVVQRRHNIVATSRPTARLLAAVCRDLATMGLGRHTSRVAIACVIWSSIAGSLKATLTS